MEPNANGNGFIMPVGPIGYGGGYGMPYGGNSFFGGNGDIWGLLFILALCGGWGFGGFGGGFGGWGMANGMWGMDMLYPWLNNSQNINDGFRDQQMSNQLSGIQQAVTSGFGDVQLGIAGVNNNICQTGSGIISAVNNGFANAETAANARQIANMQQAFASQTATTAGLNAVQGQIAQVGSNSRADAADVKYTIASEACNTRQIDTANTQAILAEVRNGIQSIKDDLCAERLANSQRETEAERRENANLRTQLAMKDLAASQIAQNGFIAQTVNSAVDAGYQRMKDCPVGTVPVFGNTPIFTCSQNVANSNANGCGCNGGVSLY